MTMANRSKVERASQSIRVTVTTSPGASAFTSFSNLAAVGPRAACLLAVNPDARFGAELFKLRVERLPVGANCARTTLSGAPGNDRNDKQGGVEQDEADRDQGLDIGQRPASVPAIGSAFARE
jgi:hypothetical protein